MSFTGPPLEIPLDIVDIIINELGADTPAIIRCSTISNTFSVSCRRHLFSSINLSGLGNFNPQTRCKDLHAVLSRSPHLIPLIRELHALNAGWVVHSSTFHSLLTLLASHGTLQAFHFGFPNPSITWVEFNGKAIRALLRSPQLHTFTLEGVLTCTFQYGLLATAPGLRHLRLEGNHSITTCDHDPIYRSGRARPPSPPFIEANHLESLAMSGNNSEILFEYLTSPGCPISLSKLRHFEISGTVPNMVQIAEEVTKRTAGTLETLHWGFPHLFDPPSKLDLHHLHRLRCLSFSVWHVDLGVLACILRTYGVPPNIKQLNIIIAVSPEHRRQKKQLFVMIDTTLSSNVPDTVLYDLGANSIGVGVFVGAAIEQSMEKWFSLMKSTGQFPGRTHEWRDLEGALKALTAR